VSASHEVGRLVFASYLDAIGEEADRLVHAADRGLDAPVPTCPGWVLADLVGHVAEVYRTFIVQLQAADPEERAPVLDDEPALDVLSALDRDVTTLLGELDRTGPDAPCWNWSGNDLVSGWVARRMALETAVHRFDGELAAGRALPIERELAIDGIDERIDVHLRVDAAESPAATLGGSVCLVCSDADAAWVVDVGGGRVRWRTGRGPADVVLVAEASELLLFTWNRVGLEGIEVTGRRDVAQAWRSLPS
jgi:uncharacterized protein (TIGR03083 family)